MKTILSTIITLIVALVLLVGCVPANNKNRNRSVSASQAGESVSRLCSVVREHYIYFDPMQTDWQSACNQATKDMQNLEGTEGRLAILEALLDELSDPHVSLNTNNQSSPRLVPTDADLWVESREGMLKIMQA